MKQNIKDVNVDVINSAARDLSTATLLFSLAQDYMESCDEKIRSQNSRLGRYKIAWKSMESAFRMFNMEVGELVKKGGGGTELCADYDTLHDVIEAYIKDNENNGSKWNWEQRYYFTKSKLNQAEQKIRILEMQ